MKCNACQTDNPAGMKFCVECGSEMLAAPSLSHASAQASRANKPSVTPGNRAIVYCSSCGTSCASDARFCPACGAAHGSVQRRDAEQISSFVETERYDQTVEIRSASGFSRIVAFTVVSLCLRMVIFLASSPWRVRIGVLDSFSVEYGLLCFALQFGLLVLIWKTAKHTSQTNGRSFLIWTAALLAVLSCIEALMYGGFYLEMYFGDVIPPLNDLAMICLVFSRRAAFPVPVWSAVLSALAVWLARWIVYSGLIGSGLIGSGRISYILSELVIVIAFTSPMNFRLIKRLCLRDTKRAQR